MRGPVLTRAGSTPRERAMAAQGAKLLCQREHLAALEQGRIKPGVPCCPHCTITHWRAP